MDVYVPQSADHPNLRIRQRGEIYEITRKVPNSDDASTQTEQTIALNSEEFKALTKASQKKVVKDRYKVMIDGREAEVDVFKDKLEGLVLIDFEFNSEAEKDAFVAPDCCLADVTQERFLAGGMLAGKSYSDIEKDVRRFNYKELTKISLG